MKQKLTSLDIAALVFELQKYTYSSQDDHLYSN